MQFLLTNPKIPQLMLTIIQLVEIIKRHHWIDVHFIYISSCLFGKVIRNADVLSTGFSKFSNS